MQTIYLTLAIYLIFFALIYSLLYEKDSKKNIKRNTDVYLLLAFALVFRFIISTSVEGHLTDISCFKSWALRLAAVGTRDFYAPDYFADYPPGYMLFLYVIGKIAKLFNLAEELKYFTSLIKLPAMVADAVFGLVLYKAAAENQTKKASLTLTAIMVLCPAIIINSAIWGQIDSVFSLFIALSLLCIYKKRFLMAAFLYTFSVLIKPQSLMVAPVYLFTYLETADWKMIGKSILIAAATVIAVALPFTRGFNFMWLIDKYSKTLSSYPYATINAYNLFAFFGYNWADISRKFLFFPISVWSYIAIGVTVAFSAWFYFKAKDRAKIFYTAYLIITVMFTIGVKMHERYLFPALFFLGLTYVFVKDKRLIFLLIVQASAHYLNVGDVFLSNITSGDIHKGIIVLSSLIHIAALIWSLYLARDIFLPRSDVRGQKAVVQSEGTGTAKLVRLDIIIMTAITLIYGVVAFTGLGDTKVPQTFSKIGDGFVADLGKPQDIGSIMMYLGIGSGEYLIEQSDDGVIWEEYSTLKHSSVFMWNRASKNTSARYLRFSSNDPSLSFGEVGIFSQDGERLFAVAHTTLPEAFDEQDAVVKKPSYMNGTYFDEIYHPRTAYEILHRLAPYETTHPPLGKLIMSVGIMMFGMTPFGWRFMGTLFGVLMVPLFYLMCKKFVRRTDISAIATIIFAFDFMHYSQTRLATVDSYAVFFIMLMYYFIWEYYNIDFNRESLKKGLIPLALCGIFFGIGAATKWICLYSALGLAGIMLIVWIRAFFEGHKYPDFNKKLIGTILWCIVFFVLIPAAVYFASYLPQIRYDLHSRTPVGYVIQNQKYMLDYHSNVTDPHPYSSEWYEWIVDKRPLWAYIDAELKTQNIISSISSFGNPAVWWGGLAAIFGCIYLGIVRKSRAAVFILIAYLSQLVPWIPIKRVLFIYHYFACVPFLVLAIACGIKYMLENKSLKMRTVYAYCAICVGLFIMFYPVITGTPVSPRYISGVLKWFDSWTFMN
ncbi:MAG: putative dolichyl-phosphate-mannose--protein mannosyltransferase [Firmicutes bacterium ADurb.Bin193]|nr:MAG: putative dolichyl-phosphate-mannose--protein mannosyltransferase [Firmicutes bacterium ADurb.Bin193]